MGDEVDANAELSARLPGFRERAVIDALPRAVIVTNAEGRIVLWNRSAEALYGWSEAEVLGCLIADILVPLSDRDSAEEIMAAMAAGESWRGDFPVLRRTGDTVDAFVIDTPILDSRGNLLAIVGASEDVTELRLLAKQSSDMSDHLALALDAGELGTWRWDMATGETTWDTRLEALYGLAPGTFAGTFDAYVSLLHPDEVNSVLDAVKVAVDEKSRYTVEHRVVWPDGSVHWLQGKGCVMVDESGAVTGTMGCVADVTERVDAAIERERALEMARGAAENERLSALRLSFLGAINDALAASPTRADVMRNVTQAAVPHLGDWCAIYVLSDGAATPDVELAHVDPTYVDYVKKLHESVPYDPAAATGIPSVIRTGRSEFVPEIDEQVLAAVDITDEGREAVRALGLRSAIAVPLIKGGRVIGALQFVNSESSRVYTPYDLALAEAVASRIASTLENRRLSEHQRMIASTLQASLLPDTLPAIPRLDLAVRYWAAGEHTTVGGDFYDVFEIGGGQWAAVIGDVCGTGPLAASFTGLARHTIRAVAWNGAQPEDVLKQLDHAIANSGRDTFCTALYCTLELTRDGLRLTVAAGGHPLPILVRADGRCETVGTYGSALGAVANPRFTAVATELRAGDAVVLYTDGVTDVRSPHDLDPEQLAGMVRLAAAAADTAEDVADGLGRRIDAHLPFAQRDDDIALLILKVTD
ncbi:MAG: SpoIIE family protein phosphatase [Acidimicrobiales bacterium]